MPPEQRAGITHVLCSSYSNTYSLSNLDHGVDAQQILLNWISVVNVLTDSAYLHRSIAGKGRQEEKSDTSRVINSSAMIIPTLDLKTSRMIRIEESSSATNLHPIVNSD